MKTSLNRFCAWGDRTRPFCWFFMFVLESSVECLVSVTIYRGEEFLIYITRSELN